MADLTTDIRYVKGIGEQRAKALNKLGIKTLRDLIAWFPRKYEERLCFRHDRIPSHGFSHPQGHGSGEGPGR